MNYNVTDRVSVFERMPLPDGGRINGFRFGVVDEFLADGSVVLLMDDTKEYETFRRWRIQKAGEHERYLE